MAVSKRSAPKSKPAPKADVEKGCAECDAKIASLEKKVSELESKLAGLLNAASAIDGVKA